MGGYGSGRQGGRATVESAWRFDIDALVRGGAIQPGAYVEGNLKFPSYDDELAIEFESSATNPRERWLRLRYSIRDYWTGENTKLTTKFTSPRRARGSAASGGGSSAQPKTGVCASSILPPGARRFRSRRAYRLAYASQREAVHDRAMRRARQALPEARR